MGSLLVATARDHDPTGVTQGKSPGGPGRGNLADTVSNISGCFDPELTQCFDDARLHRKEQRLRDIGTCHRAVIGAVLETLDQRPAELWPNNPVQALYRSPEGCAGLQGIATHARELRAIARENKCELPIPDPAASDNGGGRFVVQNAGEHSRGRRRITSECDEPVRMLIAPSGGCS